MEVAVTTAGAEWRTRDFMDDTLLLNRVCNCGYPTTSLDPRTIDRLAVLAAYHRVPLTFAQAVASGGGYQSWAAERVRRRDQQLKVLEWLATESRAASVSPLLLKGLAVEQYYPSRRLRYSNDVDLLVRDEMELGSVAKMLTSRHWRLRGNSSLQAHKSATGLVGKFRFDPVVRNAGLPKVEVCLRAFPLRSASAITIDGLAPRDRSASFLGAVGLRTPDRMGSLVILLAEQLERDQTLLRDTDDYRAIMAGMRPCECTHVEGVVRKLGLLGELVRLRRAAQIVKRSSLFYGTRRSTRRRVVRQALGFHTQDATVQRGLTMALHVWRAEVALHWFQEDRALWLLKLAERLTTVRRELQRGHIVHLLPLTQEPVESWTWRTIGPHSVWSTPIGTFLATLNCIHESRELEELRRSLVEEARATGGGGNSTWTRDQLKA